MDVTRRPRVRCPTSDLIRLCRKLKPALLCLSLVYQASAAVVTPDEYRGKAVEQIRFEPAKQPIPSDQLQKILPIKPRAPLQPSQVRAAVKALYATGRFADVAVEAQPAAG